MSSRIGGTVILVRQLGLRIFSASSSAAVVRGAASGGQFNAFLLGSGSSCTAPVAIVRYLPVRMASTSASTAPVGGEEDGSSKGQVSPAANPSGSKQLTSYWGVAPRKLFKEDGSEWRWSCFRVNRIPGQSLRLPISFHESILPRCSFFFFLWK